MNKEVKTSLIVIIQIIFIIAVISMIRSCNNDKKHLANSYKEISKLKSTLIDSIRIKKYDLNGIEIKMVLKDSLLKQRIVNSYLNLVKYQYGYGRYSSDSIVLDFYFNNKTFFSSIAWVNDFSTLVFIKSKTKDIAPYYDNLLMNKELGEILMTLNID